MADLVTVRVGVSESTAGTALWDDAIQFGSEVVRVTPDGVEPPGREGWKSLFVAADRVPRDRLYLLTQTNGRFRPPRTPAVHGVYWNGRYSIVTLDPKDAERIADPHVTLSPLAIPSTVFADVPRKEVELPSESVSAVLDTIDVGRLEADVRHLVSFETRYSTSTEYHDAARWAAASLAAAGCEVDLQEILVAKQRSWNVVGIRRGQGPVPRAAMLVTAHLDSIGSTKGARAPGADDNASGVAGVLEIARVLANRTFTPDVHFILFGGEEQFLKGSHHYVTRGPRPSAIQGVVNMDMIANLSTPARTMTIEGVPLLSRSMIDGLIAAARTYTDLRVQIVTDGAALAMSDHISFIRQQISGVLLIEGNGRLNRFKHTADDVVKELDFELMRQIVRANLAFLIRACAVDLSPVAASP